MSRFRIGLSRNFFKPDGSPAYRDVDFSPLGADPRIELVPLADPGRVRHADAMAFDAVILLGESFGPEDSTPECRLALIARLGVGYDRIDVAACSRGAIALAITPDGVRRPVAVAILTLILALAGKLFEKDRLTRQAAAGFARRHEFMGMGLEGRVLGQIGLGNIGAELVRVIAPLGMKVIAHDPYAEPAAAARLGVALVDLATLFAEADFVSVSCPLTPATHHLVNAERLALMKPSAYLINTARGPVVDQRALTAALQDRRIAGAGLDVLEDEPPRDDDPILALDNVILTPHALCWTDQCFGAMAASDVTAVRAVMAGSPPAHIVNRDILANPAWLQKLAAYGTAFKA
jgi:D-3-phosphoglycerate dehydrogenase